MGDGGGHDIAAPGVLDGHGDACGNAEVAYLARPRQAADLGDLEVDHVHGAVGDGAQEDAYAVDVLVEDEGQGGAPPHGQAFLIGAAGLLDVDVEVAHGLHDACRLVHGPAGVAVGDQHVAGLQRLAAGADALDVQVGVAADLELELGV